MWFQPLIYFSAVVWALAFVAYGLYAAFRSAPIPFSERAVGFVAAILVAAAGAGAMIGVFYIIEELI